MPKIKVENLYRTAITSSLGIASSGDVNFTVTTAPVNTNGYIVISPDSTTLREIMYYHDVIGNTIYVRSENRISPKAHSKNEIIQINDIAEIFNTYSDMISTCFYAEKTGWLNMKIWGGTVYYNGTPQTVADTNITLVNNTTNYVKYDFATNTISVDQTNSGNIKITIVTLSGIINSINYNVSKESLATQWAQGIQGIQWIQWATGVTGNGIASIALISTVWLVKTYRITYTNASTFDYTVTDWANGTNGTNGTNWTNGTNGTDWLDVTWLGAYNGATAYVINDAISYNGSSYICKLASTGNLPTNSTYFDVMALKGTDWSGTWDVVWPWSSTDNALARFDSTTGKLLQNWVITESDNGDFANVNAIQMDITPTSVTTGEGVISWNSTEKTLDIQTWLSTTTLQVWREMHMQVRNNTGSTITNWSVVYINWAASSMSTVALAQSNDYTKSIKMLWVATMDISTASNGLITTMGYVHDLNTSGFAVGDVLYLSNSVSGGITNVNPTGINYTIEIGICVTSHATTGIINVNIRVLRAIESDEFKVVDSTDKTKQAAFVVSGISSWTKRQFTLPNADTTLIGTTTTDTLTNKSISLGTNTVTSTFAQLNTAVTDANLARTDAWNTFTGTQVLSWTGRLLDIGDDASFHDVNIADCVALKWQVDATKARLQLWTSAYVQGNWDGSMNINGTVITSWNIELGNASDTTISRVSAGKMAVEGVNVLTTSSTETVTNKNLISSTNIIEEITTTASSATPTPTGGSLKNFFTVTALAAGATFGAPSGTPVNGNTIIMRVKDNGTARTLAYNAIYRAIGVTLPTTTVISKTMYFGMKYNSTDSKWDIIAYGIEA